MMRLIILVFKTLLLVTPYFLTSSVYAQRPCPEAPNFDSAQQFCSEEVWAKIGEDADFLGDLPIHVEKETLVLTWYHDADLRNKISNPKNERLTDGATYYVTQINKDGCESDPLKIVVSEKDCGCIKDPGFEDQNGNPSARGYEFYQFTGTSNHKSCGQTMFGASRVNLGAIDGYRWQDNVTLVTSGYDPTHIDGNGNPTLTIPNHPRTNPNNPYSTHGLRLNRGAVSGGRDGRGNISSMTKKFIAGEVFSFNFSVILQNTDHSYDLQPFAQVNLYDENENLIQTRCIVSDSEDCIFNKFSPDDNTLPVLYSDWSCMKLNTADHIGKPVRAEFITAYCQPMPHYTFMYIDDLYAGDDRKGLCENVIFGNIEISSVTPTEDVCYNTTEIEQNLCSSAQHNNVPGFPIYVCGEYAVPISKGNPSILESITLTIIQDDVVVGNIKNPKLNYNTNTFCFLVKASDIDVLPYGRFTFSTQVDFALNCGNEYHLYIEDQSRYGFCPSAGCPDLLQICDLKGDGYATFDLTNHGDIFYGTNWSENDVKLSYYEKEQDALDQTNKISNPKAFENTQAYNQVVYIRLDWDVEGAASDCYYLVPLDLEVTTIPSLRYWEEEIVFCGGEKIDYPLIATPLNIEDLKFVNYKWFKDGVQLPHSGSHYIVKEPGNYKVTISEENCEISQTIKISQVSFEINFDQREVELCDVESYTIKPSITPIGETALDLDRVTYTWNTGETGSNITVTETGTYTLEIAYENCIYQENIHVRFLHRPEIKLIDEIKICRGSKELVTPNITHPNLNKLYIQWYRDGGLIAENVTELEISDPGIYKLIAGDLLAEDCEQEVTFNVSYYHNEDCIVPEGLSPNKDGFNDYLDLEYLHEKSGIYSLQIYNRYGLEVYSKTNYKKEWHGQSKDNKTLPVGVYFYIIKLKDGSDDITGNIYLNY